MASRCSRAGIPAAARRWLNKRAGFENYVPRRWPAAHVGGSLRTYARPISVVG